ncbi:MAG: hypothetical protein JNK34_06100 [Tabrizicola sp.]|nr:hypothetical protein [Tabrizicola sp.]
MTSESRPGGSYAYTYNAAGRMNAFSINGMLQATYTYDAMGRQAIRSLTSPSPVTIHSVFDSQGRRIVEYDEATGTLLREYVWNGWEPVALVEGGTVYYVRADHIGRPVFATNSAGAKVWEASYHHFGGVHTSTGNLPANRFPGQWFQSESGLHQNWMRDYDPTTGRYLEPDPLGLIDGASVYGYAGQSPMMNMDPSGRCIGPWAIVCAGAAWGAISVYVGWLLDPDCYTWQEGVRDFTVGFAFGGFGQAWNAAFRAGAAGNAAYRAGAAATVVDPITFKTGHYAPRLGAAGVNTAQAEAAVRNAVTAIRSSIVPGADFAGRMSISGKLVEYRARLLPNGTVNVGTIFVVK